MIAWLKLVAAIIVAEIVEHTVEFVFEQIKKWRKRETTNQS